MIVEDETLAQNVIQTHLARVEGFEPVGACKNALEASNVLKEREVYLIFLTYNCPA